MPPLQTGKDLVDVLASQLGDGAVLTDSDRLASYVTDQSGAPGGTPAAVVLASSSTDVALVLAACHATGTPVVPRGAGSGLAGGATAVDGGVVLSMERMDAVLEVAVDDGYAEVQPGVVNQALRTHVARHGLWYAPDPASKDFCTLGGNVATNAGGLCCVKYGVTRDNVLGLRAVLADGREVTLGRRSLKGVAGYDLAGLLVGSEGTLAVVTQARLRLRPLPPPATTVVALFDTLAAAGRAVHGVLERVVPSLLELMDATTLAAVQALRPMGLAPGAAALLLVQTDAAGAGADGEADAVLAACEAAGASEAYRSENAEESDALLAARRLAIPALEAMGRWLLDDIAVPRGHLIDAVAGVEEVAARYQVTIGTFGHAGDGNLHPTIVVPHGDEDAAARAQRAFDDIVALAIALGGTVTGEHGVGVLKRAGLAAELDPVAAGLHVAVKAAFDPRGILNPGKALPAVPALRPPGLPRVQA